jgi:hypothetical protein
VGENKAGDPERFDGEGSGCTEIAVRKDGTGDDDVEEDV